MIKKIAFLVLVFFNSTAQSMSMVAFDHLFQHPNTTIADMCIPPGQCGGSLLQEFQWLKQELQIISGENNISHDLYMNLEKLDIERTRIINDFVQKYKSSVQKLTEISEELKKNCEFSTQYLTSETQQCLGDDNYERLETEINNKWDELEVALNENILTKEQVDKIESIGLSLIDTLDEVTIYSISANESLTLEIETSTNYVNEQNRIAEEKRKAEEEKIKAEERRIAEEKRKAEERRIAEEKRKAEEELEKAKNRERAQNNPGFRGLKPGLHYDDVLQICSLKKIWDDKNTESFWSECFGIDNISFKGSYVNYYLDTLTLDMGPITDDGYYLDIFRADDANIYTKMKKSLSDKYELEFEYSERDRQLFNENEKSSLFHAYSKGQVILEIKWINKDYSKDLRLYIHYLDETPAKAFIDANKPVRAAADDF